MIKTEVYSLSASDWASFGGRWGQSQNVTLAWLNSPIIRDQKHRVANVEGIPKHDGAGSPCL
ncbi:hypothetical protein LIA77_05051 [Sarocladium implicatum]|nr:hypothetical protein LIA77_05051 [Sarocladium implicatum]